MADTYPSGIFSAGNGPPDELDLDNQPGGNSGNDPSWLSGPYLEMSERWQPILICMGGTQAFRENAASQLPIEPKEDDAAWRRRVSHAVLSPFLVRIADQAAGLIAWKAIMKMEDPDQPVDRGGKSSSRTLTASGPTSVICPPHCSVFAVAGYAATMVDFMTEPAPTCRWSVSWVCGPTGSRARGSDFGMEKGRR